jgi:hypothetical protein
MEVVMMRLTGSHRIRSITILLALACGLTVSCGEGDGYTGGNGGPGGTTDKSEPTSHSQSKALLALIRDFPDPQGLVDMYNKYTADDGPSNPARDIGVSFPGAQFLSWVDQLNGIEGLGGKQTSYFSIQDIEAALDTDKSRGITWIYYDLEGDYSPSSEVNDPINAINTAASKVHSRGLKFAFTVVNVGQHPRNIIPHVVSNADGYNPQGQGFITQGTEVYAREVGDVIILAKQANPNILVWAQLSLIKGDVETNKEAFKKLYDYVSERSYTVDGVTVFYGRDSSHLSMLDEFYAWFSSTYR